MAGLSRYPYPYYQVCYLGHSLVTCDTLRPQTEPVIGVNMEMIRKSGARVDRFFEYPAFQPVLQRGYHLVIVMLGGNDINEATDPNKLAADYLAIHQAIESHGAKCVLCTVEKRVYKPGHIHYVEPEVYRKIMNAVNRKLARALKGKLILLGGKTYPLDLRTDGIHPTFEGRRHIWNKVVGAIKFHHEEWLKQFN